MHFDPLESPLEYPSSNWYMLTCVQAEEERKCAEEEAAAKEAAELAANPVLRMRKFIASAASPADVAAELKTVDVQGGHIGRMRVLYEVCSHSLLAQSLAILMPCVSCAAGEELTP